MRALVTGATSGIGKAYAFLLAEHGYDLILSGRRALLSQVGERIQQRCKVKVQTIRADFRDEQSVSRFIQQIAHVHDIAYLVNNAGFGYSASIETGDLSTFAAMLNTHCYAPLTIVNALLPVLKQNSPAYIVNVSSPMGYIPMPRATMYCATKAFLTLFSEALAAELKHDAITVQALLPGLTKTDFHIRDQRWNPPSRNMARLLWMSAQAVASYSFRKARNARKVLCIPGVVNKLLLFVARALPRKMLYTLCAHVAHTSQAEE